MANEPIEKIYEDVQLHIAFSQAASRSNIVTYDSTAQEPENISTAFGKLSKWYEALVPTGGSSGKILAWNSSGTAKWSDPLHPTITKSVDTTSTASPAHGGTFTTVDEVVRDANGHVTKINTKTVKLPSDQNTDTLVSQTFATASNKRPLLMSYYKVGEAAGTAQVAYRNDSLYCNPSNGRIFATGFYTSGWDTSPASTSASLQANGLVLRAIKTYGDGHTLDYNRYVVRTYSGKTGLNTSDWSSNGMLVTVEGGGLTIVGGGGSAASLAGLISDDYLPASGTPNSLDVNGDTTTGTGYLHTSLSGSSENLILSADTEIYFVTNANTIANRKAARLTSDLYFAPLSTNTGSIGTSTYQWNTIFGKTIYENGTSLASKYEAIGHKHTTTIAADSGTNQLTLAASTKYKLTAGGTNFIFTTPPNTTYSAGTGLSLSGTTINHSNSVTAVTNYNKPYVKYDAQGHITESSYWTATAAGTGGESGWVKVATMVHTDTHDDTPIMLLVSQRGSTITYKLHIVWKNTSNTDPDIDKFRLSSDIDINADAYIKKSTTSTWELYIKKLDNWDAIAMHLYVGKYFPDHMTWTWQDVQTAESAITGGIEAEKIVPYNYYQSRTANTVLAAPNGSDGKASFRKLVATDIPDLDYVSNTQEGVIDAINLLSEELSTPSLADYYVSQFVNGGTTSKSYHRRPISALWDTFKGLITLTTTGSGNAVTGVSIANDGDHNRKITVTKGSTFSLSTHTHGLLHSDLNQASTNGTTGGWSVIGIDPAVTGYVLKSIRVNTTSPDWLSGDYGAGIAFGGSDTKGVISMNYQSPVITFAGGNHNSSKTAPVWYFKISGTSGSTYDLANFNAATATKLATAQTINGVSFDGSADITIPRSIKHIHTAKGTDGSGGWVKIARITVTEAHADQPMTFTIAQRSIMQYRIHLLFTNNGSAAATAISEFIITRDNSWTDTNNDPRAYIIKPSDGIFDLYIRKTVSWDRIFVVDFTKADDGGGINYSITWENVHVADSAITGGTEAVKKLYLPTTTNYAGSSSAGGAATSANKLNTDAGATNRPVYFSGGVPVQCDTPASGSWFKGVPLITTDGVMEFGKYIDFHKSNDSTADYDLRLQYTGTATGKTVTIPGASGYVALLAKGGTSFYGMMDGDGTTSGWIRATSNGFIPSAEARFFQTATSSLGTSTWYFKDSYIQNMSANRLVLGVAKMTDGAAKGQVKFFSGNANDTTGTVTLECVNDSARTGDYTVKLPTWNGTIPVFEKLFEGASNNVSLSFSDINEYDLFLITVANSNATTEQVTVTSLWISNVVGVHDMPLIWGGTPSSSGGACNVTSGWIQLSKSSGTTTFSVAHKTNVAQMTSSGWTISSPTYNLYIRKIYGLKAFKRT